MKINSFFNIGISSIGSGVGQSVINSIRLSNLPIKTFGFGTNPLAYGLYECDMFIPSVSFYDDNYVEDTIQKCIENNIILYIPGHDDDANICSQNFKKFENNGIKIIVAGEKLLKICRDKELMSNELNKTVNIFVRSFDKNSFLSCLYKNEIELPVIAKPRDGYASKGIEIINTLEDVAKITENHIVQELAIPHVQDSEREYYLKQLKKGINPQVSEISIQLVADEKGNIMGRMMSYNKLNNGIPIEIIPYDDESIWNEVDKLHPILKKLGLKGPFNLQGRLTDSGLKLFELNARFTGITGLRAFMGFNEVEACIKQWLGIRSKEEMLVLNYNRFGIRQTADRVIDFDRNNKVLDIYKRINKSIVKSKKIILISGATGYLGRNLVKELLLNYSTDFEIWLLVRDKQKINSIFKDRIKSFDIFDFENGILSIGNVDIFLHAGFSRPHSSSKEIAESIAFSSKILGKAFQNHVANIINISSQSVYGQGSKIPWSENTVVATNSSYGSAKYSIEQLVEVLKGYYPHINATSIRLGSITGGANGLINIDLISKLVSNVLQGESMTIMGGDQIIERLDIRDAVTGIISIFKNTEKKWNLLYNLSSGKQYSLIEIAEEIKKCAKKMGYSSDFILQENDCQLQFGLNVESFKNQFGWQPECSLEDTIISLFNYLKK